ncbi:MAG TPA: hypothetical protein PKY89_11330 [Deltaproteobacteria bacterium]|nr:hypothetical protein [Deltaproteobacteria bacterium]
MHDKAKGRFTIRSAGVLFMLSAAFELLSLTSPVPLLGTTRGGFLMAAYHVIYIILFLIIGVGLWAPKSWGYRAVFAGAVFFTLDRVLFIFDRATMETYLLGQLGPYREILQMIDTESLVRIYGYVTVMSIACWWGFVLYLHLRREYFSPPGD